ncbi:hypothetical protein KDM41_07460 [bacterium]|nr:hypothetical protein [bacterium]
MAMDKVNGSPLLRQGLLEQSRQQEKVDGQKRARQQSGADVPVETPPRGGDTAEISAAALRMMDLRLAVDAGREALGQLEEIRADKVALARERLHNGYYRTDEVRERVAEGLAGLFGGTNLL